MVQLIQLFLTCITYTIRSVPAIYSNSITKRFSGRKILWSMKNDVSNHPNCSNNQLKMWITLKSDFIWMCDCVLFDIVNVRLTSKIGTNSTFYKSRDTVPMLYFHCALNESYKFQSSLNFEIFYKRKGNERKKSKEKTFADWIECVKLMQWAHETCLIT